MKNRQNKEDLLKKILKKVKPNLNVKNSKNLSFVNDGDWLNLGERFGLIRFGSRVDVYLPKTFKSEVKVGDKTIAGETIIGSS